MNANEANGNYLPGHSLNANCEYGTGCCSCGKHSARPLTKEGRRQWHRDHKDEIRQQIKETPIEAPAPFPYMTAIMNRNPRQKPHESLGQAKKAVLYRLDTDETLSTYCEVYKWTDKGWETLWQIKSGTKRQDLPWVAESRR